MDVRTWTAAAAGLLALTICVLGATLPVPMVAISAGPTHDTLGDVNGGPVVAVDGLPVYPTSGHLNMTTVTVADGLNMFEALASWASGEQQVVPRAAVYSPSETQEQIERENAALFDSSEINAESAVTAELQLPADVFISMLVDGTPAAAVLRPGDQLTVVARQPINSVRDVSAALNSTRPGDTINVTFRRDGVDRSADIALVSSPDRQQGFFGVVASGALRNGEITFSLGGIGGPSAGLIFALALLDKLTPGELAGDRFIAGTGVIDSVGTVREISGIRFKMQRAREAGATVFLVPANNCEEAVATGPDGLQLIRVGNLHDAVVALEALNAGRSPVSC